MFGVKKLKALLIALCLVLAILIFSIPDVNYGHGPDHAAEPAKYDTYEYTEEE